MDKAIKNYEIGFLAKTEDGEEEIAKALKASNGLNIERGPVLRIRLAYPIKKETAAFFGYFYFSAEPSAIAKIKSDLKMNSKILRFLVIFAPKKQAGAVRQSRLSAAEPPAQRIEEGAVKVKADSKPQPPFSARELSNEELEKKLEEVLGIAE